MLYAERGGIHPAGRKKETRAAAVTPLPPVTQVVLPLASRSGAGSAPLVRAGDRVCVGQMLCAAGPRFAAVHASVSGRVLCVEPRLQVWGGKVLSAVLENDGKDTQIGHPGWERSPRADAPQDLTPGEIISIAALAGLSGMGGGGFPTAEKLRAALGRADKLILNGAECEPYVSADHRLMLERPAAVLGGARLFMRALGLSGAVIAVEGDKYDAAAALRAALPLRGGDISVRILKARYPAGSERQLVRRLIGRTVPSGGLPADVGCAVFNVATAAALYDAVYSGTPLVRRIVTVAGSAVAEPKNLLVPLGAPLEELIRAAGGWKGTPDRVVVGGPMMGLAQFDLSVGVDKGTGAVLAMTAEEVAPVNLPEGTCLRCGRCADACPLELMPVYIRQYVDACRWHELSGLNVNDCMECGACAFVCPAHLRLVHSIRVGKEHLRESEREKHGKGDGQ